MILKISRLSILLVFVLGTNNLIQGQTLIRETSKNHEIKTNWKIEWGIITSAGVSNVLKPELDPLVSMPEGMNTYRVKYAPRPEAEIGFFGEIGKTKSKFSFQARLAYTMRAVPEPVFYSYANTTMEEVYKSTYLNGLTVGALFCFKPVKNFKIGLGLDFTNFLITHDVQDSNIGEYTELYSSAVGFRAMLSYQVSPRVDLSIYGRAGKLTNMDMDSKMTPDDISGGLQMCYRLFGKEIRHKVKIEEKKEVYRIDYNK